MILFWGDGQYDDLTRELMQKRVGVSGTKYGAVVDPALGDEGSGFSIRDYPQEIVDAALRRLYSRGDWPSVDAFFG